MHFAASRCLRLDIFPISYRRGDFRVVELLSPIIQKLRIFQDFDPLCARDAQNYYSVMKFRHKHSPPFLCAQYFDDKSSPQV